PLPGVKILIKGTTTGTVSDINGNYSITTNTPDPTLVFSFVGLQTSEVDAKNKADLDVTLAEDLSQLSEVVVTGTSLATDDLQSPVIRLAEPFGGRKAYDKYLDANLHYPDEALAQKIKGRVLIEFTVATDGSLTDFNVLRSLGHGCDEEVIRLVKQGPKWFPTTQNNVPVESNVRVRMKFDPAKARK
ncbi:MAG: TonB family protein, partial [Bacteroidota bacterium]